MAPTRIPVDDNPRERYQIDIMKSSYLLVALCGVLTLPCTVGGQSSPAKSNTARVLLLDNFQIIEGAVEQNNDGDYVLMQGKETRKFPAKQVLFAGNCRDDVHKFLQSRAKSGAAVPPPAIVKTTDFNSAAAKLFPTKIEPVLMNLCANCHAKPDHTSSFKLTRILDGYANTEASQKNLRATVAFIRRDDPSQSDLLLKTVTVHGGQRDPAIHLKAHPAYKNLELWLHWATLPEGTPLPLSVPTATKLQPAILTAQPVLPIPTVVTVKPSSILASQDPFDPNEFNRLIHVKK